MRHALARVPRKQRQPIATVIRTASEQKHQAEARRQWRETADKLRDQFPKVSALMDDAEYDLLAFIKPAIFSAALL